MFGLSERQLQWWRRIFGRHPLADRRKTIEVAIWHQDRLDAAHVMRAYAEQAIETAFGDQYDVDVWVREKSVPSSIKVADDVFGWLQGEDRPNRDDGHLDEKAKDANLVLLPNADSVGGGSVCVTNADTPWGDTPNIGDLWQSPLKNYVCNSEPHDAVSSGLHEIGHCLGLGHDVGGVVRHQGREYVSVMPYSDKGCLFLGYGPGTADALRIQ